jgi:hypothetical protein
MTGLTDPPLQCRCAGPITVASSWESSATQDKADKNHRRSVKSGNGKHQAHTSQDHSI